jgi:hypothetical protein
VGDLVKSKKIQFGPGDTLGNTARLILLGSIDACEPRRKRHRAGLGTGLFWLLLLTTLGVAAWLILDGFQRGVIPTALS